MRCVQPSAFSVPSSRDALADRREREQRGEQERGDRGERGEREAEPVREVRGVDERAADLVGDLLRARDLRVRERRLDLLLHGGDGACRPVARTSTTFARPAWLASFCSFASGT